MDALTMARSADSGKKISMLIRMPNGSSDHGVAAGGDGEGLDNIHGEKEEVPETNIDLEDILLGRDSKGKNGEEDSHFMTQITVLALI